jgi:hypothetical protein
MGRLGGSLPCVGNLAHDNDPLCRASYTKTHGKHFCIIKIFVIAFDILKLLNDFQIFI